MRIGDIEIDFKLHQARRGKARIEFTAREFDLLRYFVQHTGQVVTREQILNEVWGYEEFPTTRTIDNFVAKLRQKIERAPHAPGAHPHDSRLGLQVRRVEFLAMEPKTICSPADRASRSSISCSGLRPCNASGRRARATRPARRRSRVTLGIVFIANFFDTLGIGSFATTTAMFRVLEGGARRADSRHAQRRPHAADDGPGAHLHHDRRGRVHDHGRHHRARRCAGAWLGAGIVAGLPRRKVQIGMGFALLGAATLMLLR